MTEQKYVAKGVENPQVWHLDTECSGFTDTEPVEIDDSEIPEYMPGCSYCTDRVGATELRKQLHGESA